ncbi:MAG: hypothetical protein CL760_04985 [Chloroflexi bacterium]|nr:hypothetical protein [Chloroflexota bacterium]|tara:strand:+ start:3061 stop:4434 length:1374 start_codon:yes stop_codon:yes gene_type:complete
MKKSHTHSEENQKILRVIEKVLKYKKEIESDRYNSYAYSNSHSAVVSQNYIRSSGKKHLILSFQIFEHLSEYFKSESIKGSEKSELIKSILDLFIENSQKEDSFCSKIGLNCFFYVLMSINQDQWYNFFKSNKEYLNKVLMDVKIGRNEDIIPNFLFYSRLRKSLKLVKKNSLKVNLNNQSPLFFNFLEYYAFSHDLKKSIDLNHFYKLIDSHKELEDKEKEEDFLKQSEIINMWLYEFFFGKHTEIDKDGSFVLKSNATSRIAKNDKINNERWNSKYEINKENYFNKTKDVLCVQLPVGEKLNKIELRGAKRLINYIKTRNPNVMFVKAGKRVLNRSEIITDNKEIVKNIKYVIQKGCKESIIESFGDTIVRYLFRVNFVFKKIENKTIKEIKKMTFGEEKNPSKEYLLNYLQIIDRVNIEDLENAVSFLMENPEYVVDGRITEEGLELMEMNIMM